MHVGYDMIACDGLRYGTERQLQILCPGFILVTKDLAKEDVADIGLHSMDLYITGKVIT